MVCKEGRPLSELPLAVYVVAATAAHRRRRAAHGGQSESKRERGREAAAALLGTTKSIESRRDFPHFISAWPPPSALTKPMDNGLHAAEAAAAARQQRIGEPSDGQSEFFFCLTLDPLLCVETT